ISPRNQMKRPLQRFPRRNQFISAYILSVTGILRTPKQVGSRLQQMKDTCRDPHVLSFLSPGDQIVRQPRLTRVSSMCSPASSSSSTASSSLPSSSGSSYASKRTHIDIRLIVAGDRPTLEGPVISSSDHPDRRTVSLNAPSDMDRDEPVIAFSTSHIISTAYHYSRFRVLFGRDLVHEEETELVEVPGKSCAYSTRLLPKFWTYLCRSSRLSDCIIEQDIVRTRFPFSCAPSRAQHDDQIIRAIAYSFTLHLAPQKPPPEPAAFAIYPSA
ncbi:unnamed protein product, partial [Mycena citricolor]